jgi:LPXTG-motif cell wall-anchored protein
MSRKRYWSIAIGCGLLLSVGASTIAAAQAQPLTLDLTAQNNSGISGTATFTESGGSVRVDIKVTGAGAGPQPAHIHPGTCTQLDATPQFTLSPVVNGTSTTTIQSTIQALTSSPHAVHMHKSQDELSVYVACADFKPASLPRTGDAASATPFISGFFGIALLGTGLLLRQVRRRTR